MCIRDSVRADQLIITIAPGKTLSWLAEKFGKDVKIVRTMPNTPALAVSYTHLIMHRAWQFQDVCNCFV